MIKSKRSTEGRDPRDLSHSWTWSTEWSIFLQPCLFQKLHRTHKLLSHKCNYLLSWTFLARKFLLIWGFKSSSLWKMMEMLRCTFSSLTQLLLDESSVHHSSPLVSFPIYHQATWKVSESVESVQKLSAWQMTLFLSTKPCYTWLKNHRKMSHLELRRFHKIATNSNS